MIEPYNYLEVVQSIDKKNDHFYNSQFMMNLDKEKEVKMKSHEFGLMIVPGNFNPGDTRKSRIIAISHYERGKFKARFQYSYDEQGRLIREEGKVRHVGWAFRPYVVCQVLEHQYDDRGHRVKTIRKDDNQIIRTIEYSYDETGSLVTAIVRIGKRVTAKQEYRYDDKGNLIWQSATGDIVSHPEIDSFEYDEQGRLVKESRLHPRGDIDHYREYEYDSRGRVIRITRKYANGRVFEATENTYSRGRLVKRVISCYGTIEAISRFERQGNKFIMRTWGYEGKGRAAKEVSEYDRHGNMVRHRMPGERWDLEYDLRFPATA